MWSQNDVFLRGWGWQPHLKLLTASILDIYKVFEHIDMLSKCTRYGNCLRTQLHPHTSWLRIWGSESLVESKWCHYVMVDADGAISNFFLLPYKTYIKCLSTLKCCALAYSMSLTQYPLYFSQIITLGFWVTCGVEMFSLHHGWGWWLPQTAYVLHPY